MKRWIPKTPTLRTDGLTEMDDTGNRSRVQCDECGANKELGPEYAVKRVAELTFTCDGCARLGPVVE